MAARTLSVVAIPSPFSTTSQSSKKPNDQLNFNIRSTNLVNCFLGSKLSIQPSNLILHTPIRRIFTFATVLSSLPTTKAERGANEKPLRWSARAIKSFAMAELEARKLKYSKTGTESLLMGILNEGTSLAAKFLREHGITLYKVQEETLNLLGKADMHFSSPQHPPLTVQAQRALDWAVNEKLKSGDEGEMTTTYILLGIWSVKESAGHKIMALLGFDDKKAEELAKSMDKDFIMSYR